MFVMKNDTLIRKSAAIKFPVGKILIHVLLIIFTVVTLFPFIWMISSAFKSVSEIYAVPPSIIPKVVIPNNFSLLLESYDFVLWYMNSVKVIIMRMGFTLTFCALGGFALAKYNFPGKKQIFMLIIGSMIIPYRVLIIPMFLTIHKLGLFNTHIALILPWIATPFGIFMMRQYLITIPDEMIEAARIDGASGFLIFLKIILPLGKAGLSSLSVVIFVWTWTAFIWPLIVLFSSEKFILTIGMSNIVGGFGGDNYIGQLMAGATLAVIPILILFLFIQRYFVAGITSGAIK
jgi:ABC-type glycerol-3-phosphate transport system permease component